MYSLGYELPHSASGGVWVWGCMLHFISTRSVLIREFWIPCQAAIIITAPILKCPNLETVLPQRRHWHDPPDIPSPSPVPPSPSPLPLLHNIPICFNCRHLLLQIIVTVEPRRKQTQTRQQNISRVIFILFLSWMGTAWGELVALLAPDCNPCISWVDGCPSSRYTHAQIDSMVQRMEETEEHKTYDNSPTVLHLEPNTVS